MARQILRTQIAYRCPECGTATVGMLGSLTAVSDMLRLKCTCGNSHLDIKKLPENKLRLEIPCIYCKDTHGYTMSASIVSREETTKLSCPFSTMDIAFISDEEKLAGELERTAKELETVMASFEAEELSDIQPSDVDGDEAFVDPTVYDTFNLIVKELEEDGKISCPCSEGKYSLRYTDEGIQVYCESCGASHSFHALTGAAAEEYVGLDSIELT